MLVGKGVTGLESVTQWHRQSTGIPCGPAQSSAEANLAGGPNC